MSRESSSMAPNVIEALRRGNRIEAIKLLRGVSGKDLAHCKEQIDAYMKVQASALKARRQDSTRSAASASNEMPSIDDAMGNAVGLLRGALGELRDSRAQAERESHGRDLSAPDRKPNDMHGFINFLWWVLALILAGYAVRYLMS